MVFEYADGGSLSRYLSDTSVELDWLMRCKLGINIIDGLRYLHELDILHKDLVTIDAALVQILYCFDIQQAIYIFVISLLITY